MFYVDHVNRRTQWSRPVRRAVPEQDTAQVDERRRRMAQTLARRNPALEVQARPSVLVPSCTVCVCVC